MSITASKGALYRGPSLTETTLALRGKGGFEKLPGANRSLRDQFDRRALHFAVSLDGRPISTARLVDARSGMLNDWLRQPFPWKGERTAVISRVVVDPEYRDRHFGVLQATHVLVSAADLGFDFVGLVCKPGNTEYWARFGFRTLPESMFSHDIPGQAVEVVGMIANLHTSLPMLQSMRLRTIGSMRGASFH